MQIFYFFFKKNHPKTVQERSRFRQLSVPKFPVFFRLDREHIVTI